MSLSRRAIVMGMPALILANATPAKALQSCPSSQSPQDICSAYIDPNRFSATQTASLQQQNQWCWAACIEMICRFHGFKISQQSIVNHVYGGIVNMAAGDLVLTQALNANWIADDGVPFKIEADVYSPALGHFNVLNSMVVDDLTNEMPLLNGSRTHATVVARVDYVPGQAGAQPVIHRVHVVDPWPGAASAPQYARFLAPDEMTPIGTPGGSLRFLARVRIK